MFHRHLKISAKQDKKTIKIWVPKLVLRSSDHYWCSFTKYKVKYNIFVSQNTYKKWEKKWRGTNEYWNTRKKKWRGRSEGPGLQRETWVTLLHSFFSWLASEVGDTYFSLLFLPLPPFPLFMLPALHFSSFFLHLFSFSLFLITHFVLYYMHVSFSTLHVSLLTILQT